MSEVTATAKGARDEIERLGIVLLDIERQINILLERTAGLTELRTAAVNLAHAHKTFKSALMSVMTTQDRLIDGPQKVGAA